MDNSNTLAKQAHDRLRDMMLTAEERRSFNYAAVRPYIMVCHGCGKLHVQRSEFISSPLAMGFSFTDRSSLSIPCYNCGNCPGEVIREAWKNGSKPEVRARVMEALGITADAA